MPNPIIRRFTATNSLLTPSSFVELIIPVACAAYLLKNAGPDLLYMRSDPNDPDAEDTMAAGFWEDLSMLGWASSVNPWGDRYAAGDVLYWVKCTGPLVGKFWR